MEEIFIIQKVENGSSIITHFHNAYMINVYSTSLTRRESEKEN